MANTAKHMINKAYERFFRNNKAHEKFFSSINDALVRVTNELVVLNSRQNRIEENLRQINSFNGRPQVQTLCFSDQEVLTKIFTDLKMYLNPTDLSVAAHIALDGIWEKEITKAWLAVLKPEDTVFDIGANFGYFGLLAGQFTNKKRAKIILFEANKSIIPYINKSLAINWLNEQTTVENFAVSDKSDEMLTLNILKGYTGSSSLQSLEELDSYMHKKMQLKLSESIQVKSITIDDYCQRNNIHEVNLIKMDIEGFEQKAYSGMVKTVKRSKNITLFVEFTKDSYDNPEAFYNEMLKDFGHVYIIDNQGAIIKPKSTSYEFVIHNADDWVMPIFSKNSNLQTK